MDVELLHDRAQVVGHADPQGLVPASGTCVLRSASGATLQTPAVTLPTVSTTIESGTTAAVLKLASAAGVVVGEPLAVVSDSETHVVTPVRIDGQFVTLAASLPVVPDAGATVKGLRMSATIAAVGLAELGAGLVLEWRYVSAAGVGGSATYEVAVVRWLWRAPISGGEVAELLATVYQTTRSPEFCTRIADRVSAKIRAAIEQTGRRPYLFASSCAFAEVAQIGVRWVLADSGIALAGDVAELVREYRFAFNDELAKAVSGMRGYDVAETGALDVPRRNVLSIQAVR